MNFNDSLETELKEISEFGNRVYPLIAQQKTEAPFLVYKKSSRKRVKTLGGITNKYETVYVLTVLSKSYSQLQDLSILATDKVWSFLGRAIGTGGPYIENVNVEETGDAYEIELELYRSDIQVTAKY